MGFPLPTPDGAGGPNGGDWEMMPVIPPGLTSGREKLRSAIYNCSPPIAPESGDGSCLPLSARCTELSISSSSSALVSVTEVPDGPAVPDGPIDSRELLVSDIKENEFDATP